MGTYTTADALMQVYRRLRDTADTAEAQLLTDTEIEDFIGQAVTRYSADRPCEMVADLDSLGTRYIGLPADFEEGFSVVRSIEYPIDDDLPSYLDSRGVDYYRTPAVVGPPAVPSALKLRSSWAVPSGTANIRIVYTGRRVLDAVAANTTVLDRDFDAVCDLAVSTCCDTIAQKYASTISPILGGSAGAPRDKADVWASRARRYEARYRDAMGPPLASAVINWDSHPSWWSPSGSWLNHPNLRR
jgi:hypothetical protein